MSTPTYRVLDVGAARIAVDSPIAAFHADLDRVYPHADAADERRFADVRVALRPGPRRLWRPQVSLWSEGARPFDPYPLRNALPLFEWGGNWLLAQRLNAYLLLHAGVVARGEHALILPASPGSGKSTLACALHLAGWRFFSDEFGVIDPGSGEVLPLLKPAALKNRSIEVIGARPGAVLGRVFAGTRKGDVAHFVPDRDSHARRHHRARPRLLVFPRYRPGSGLQCRPVAPADAAMRLGLNSFNYRTLGPVGFAATVRIARTAHAWEIEYDCLDAAIARIDQLLCDALGGEPSRAAAAGAALP